MVPNFLLTKTTEICLGVAGYDFHQVNRYSNPGVDLTQPVFTCYPFLALVEKWSLFGGHLCNKSSKKDLKMVVYRQLGGRDPAVVVFLGLTVLENSFKSTAK